MAFTNVAWESRSTEQLARDLTDGPGPMSVGQGGAAWVRVARELTEISADYDNVVGTMKSSFIGQGGDAANRKLEDFGRWLQSLCLSAAANGERAEEAAVAYSVAVLAMPSVSEVLAAKAEHDVMSSLAAYNGAIINGQFAELDEAAASAQSSASEVMYQYEETCNSLATPWEQPAAPDVSNGAALRAERDARRPDAADGVHHGVIHGGGAGAVSMPLAPFVSRGVASSAESKAPDKTSAGSASSSSVSPMGTGYGPMAAAAGRTENTDEHQSSLISDTLEGAGEPGATPSTTQASWLPAAQQSDAPFTVSHVSWGPDTSVFDGLTVPDQPDTPLYADEPTPTPTLDQVSDRWVAPPVIGTGKGSTL